LVDSRRHLLHGGVPLVCGGAGLVGQILRRVGVFRVLLCHGGHLLKARRHLLKGARLFVRTLRQTLRPRRDLGACAGHVHHGLPYLVESVVKALHHGVYIALHGVVLALIMIFKPLRKVFPCRRFENLAAVGYDEVVQVVHPAVGGRGHYSDLVRASLDIQPVVKASLAPFADQFREAADGFAD